MKITLAKNSGFCFGVKRALNGISKLNDVNTLGPLIHNKKVIENLERRGIKSVDSLDDMDSKKIVIRAHGVANSVIEEAERRGLKVIDLTCPFVRKVHDMAKELERRGYTVVVAGERNHPEVLGITGDLKNFIIVDKPCAVKKLERIERAGAVAQTTQNKDNFTKIIGELRKKADELVAYNTICSATLERQNSARELAKKADLMIVIGDNSSANTKRLTDICSGVTETKQVEGEEDLKEEWFNGKKHVGVTAGASTPEWIIKDVIKKIL